MNEMHANGQSVGTYPSGLQLRPGPCQGPIRKSPGRLRIRLLLPALALLSAVVWPAAAQQIVRVDPAEATIGTALLITGNGFGAARPHVTMVAVASGKRRRLRVVKFDTTSITARISTRILAPGAYNLVVRAAGAALVTSSPVTVQPPSNLRLDRQTAAPGGLVILTSDFLGPHRGRIQLSGRRARVLQWRAEGNGVGRVAFRVPVKLAPGRYDVEVRNRVGRGIKRDALVIGYAGDTAVPAPTVPAPTARRRPLPRRPLPRHPHATRLARRS